MRSLQASPRRISTDMRARKRLRRAPARRCAWRCLAGTGQPGGSPVGKTKTSHGNREIWSESVLAASVLSPKYEVFCCDQNGPPARRSELDWRMEGAYLNRYVTDKQRSRRPIFIATLWAWTKYLVFRGQDTSGIALAPTKKFVA